MSVYRQLRSLCQQLKSHTDDDSGLHSDCSTTSVEDGQQFTTGLLTEIAQELVGLVLDSDVVNLMERIERYRREIHERDLDLQKRADINMELTSKVIIKDIKTTDVWSEQMGFASTGRTVLVVKCDVNIF